MGRRTHVLVMVEEGAEKLGDVVVVEPVVRTATVAPHGDEPALAEQTELV